MRSSLREVPGGAAAAVCAATCLALMLLLSGLAGPAWADASANSAPAAAWKAPSRAARKRNPKPGDETTIAAGKKVYLRECISCHGEAGKGDGPAASDLERKPGNLSLPAMWDQSDGALFWKITTGRKPMPTFSKLLTVEERWLVIDYIRTLAPRAPVDDTEPAPPATPAPIASCLDHVIQAYRGVGEPLRSEDLAAARKALPAAADAVTELSKIDGKDLADTAQPAWASTQKRMSAAVTAMKDAEDLAHLRSAYRGASDALAEALETFGNPVQVPLVVYRCSDAFDGAGAVWIQVGKEAHCPYVRSADPASCKIVKTLGTGADEGKGGER